MKPTAYIMVGFPGLGKSYRVAELCDMIPDVFVYSTDAILEEIAASKGLTYNDVFADNIKDAQSRADLLANDAFVYKLDIIFDQTNLTEKKRRRLIDRAKRNGYKVFCEYIRAPEAGHLNDQKYWARRLRNRPGKTIPDHVMKTMVESFKEPTIDEGFDELCIFNMHGEKIETITQ